MLYIQETEGGEGGRGRAFGGFGGDFVSAHLYLARVEERKKEGGKWSNETRTDAWRGNKSLTEAVRNFENSATADAPMPRAEENR